MLFQMTGDIYTNIYTHWIKNIVSNIVFNTLDSKHIHEHTQVCVCVYANVKQLRRLITFVCPQVPYTHMKLQ